MFEFIRSHWRGNLPLAISYWVNNFLLSLLLYAGIVALEQPLSRLRLEPAVALGFATIVLIGSIAVWQLVGLWRSATKSSVQFATKFWPTVAKGLVILGFIGNGSNVIISTNDLLSLLEAVRSPNIAAYSVERFGEPELLLSGAINDDSADEVIRELQDPRTEILRINSHGGLIEPALRLARHVRDSNVSVRVEGQCVSACVWILAASRNVAIYPGSIIVFHASEAVVKFHGSETREAQRRYIEESYGYYAEFGIPNWIVEEIKQHIYWVPTIEELIDIGLIRHVFDLAEGKFVLAEDYCAGRKALCRQRLEPNWVKEARQSAGN